MTETIMTNTVITESNQPEIKGETYEFQAEINQLMSIIVNAFYSNKEIFLRELISNSSDALEKINYYSLTDPTRLGNNKDLRIDIIPDKQNSILNIRDTGLGMTKADLINNLGTIARSGTKSFAEALKDGTTDVSMIGQFGVGFYSAYLVADKVEVISKHDNDDQYIWSSTAGGQFTVAKDTSEALGRGTLIRLYIKKDHSEFLDKAKLCSVIKKHSSFIKFPIYLTVEVEKEVEISEVETAVEGQDINVKEEGKEKGVKIEEITEEEVEKQEKKKETRKEITTELEHLNKIKPVWMRNPKDVTHEEYSNFYKAITNDWEDHSRVKHFVAEGQLEFNAILFIPSRAPFDLFEQKKKKKNIKLYVRGIFINDSCEELIPEYLNFVVGVINSPDLPLNISRETLQQTKTVKVVGKTIVKKCLELFDEVMENKEEYDKFYSNFSKSIKLGIHEDSANRKRLASFLRYNTINNQEKLISLKEYVDNMPERQKNIYYITGEQGEGIKNSIFTERFKKEKFDVIMMTDPIDEYTMQQLTEFEGKKLVSITKGGVEFEFAEEKDKKKTEEEKVNKYQYVCDAFKEVLDKLVEDVRISERITESPCCVVTSQYGWSANMERIFKAQALRDSTMPNYMMSKKTLEINPDHSIIKFVAERIKTENGAVGKTREVIKILYDTSLLGSGFSVDDPNVYCKKIFDMLKFGMDIYADDSIVEGGEEKIEEEKVEEIRSEIAKMEEVD